MRRRAIYPASRPDAGEARGWLDRGVNPVTNAGLTSRDLARGRLSPQHRLQLSDRGLEARHCVAAARAAVRAAARPTRDPRSARMGQPALAAPLDLPACGPAREPDRDVLGPGAERACERSAGRLDRAEMHAGAAAAEHRGTGPHRQFKIAPAACRGAGAGPARDRSFRLDLSGQAAECAAVRFARH